MRPPPAANKLKRTLVIPAALAVASLAPACVGKDEPAPTTGSSTTEAPTSGSTTGAPTSGGDHTSTSGEPPDCPIWDDDPETCSSMVDCLYLLNQEVCIVRCNNFKDEASCEMQAYCYWEAGGCYLAV